MAKISGFKKTVDSKGKVQGYFIIICEKCGKEFNHIRSDARYCGEQCRQHEPKPLYELICRVCGKSFHNKYSHAITCGPECREAYTEQLKIRKEYVIICQVCQKTFESNQPHAKLCSEQCRKINYLKTLESAKARRAKKKLCRPQGTGPILPGASEKKQPINRDNISGMARLTVLKRDGFMCYICRKETNLHVHHIVPRRLGGSHVLSNLVTLCGGCHRSIESGNTIKAIESCVKRALDNTE